MKRLLQWLVHERKWENLQFSKKYFSNIHIQKRKINLVNSPPKKLFYLQKDCITHVGKSSRCHNFINLVCKFDFTNY